MFLVLSWQWDKEEILCPHKESNLRTLDFSAPYLYRVQNLPSILITNNILLTLLILAICWMHVIYELCNGPCSPWSLCGSVIKHQSTKKIWRSEVMGTQKFSLPSSKFTIYLILLTNIMLLTSLILAICWIRLIYELCNGPCSPWMSLWLSGRASEHGKIQRSEAMGTQKFFFVWYSWQDKKHLSQFLYQTPKLTIFLIL